MVSCDTRISRVVGEGTRPEVAATAPELVAQIGVGTDTAGALLVAAGENATASNRSFARLCGAAPLDGPRAANSNGTDSAEPVTAKPTRALWRIVISRLSHDPDTRDYLERRLRRRQDQDRSHPLPQALRRPRPLPPPPAPNAWLRRRPAETSIRRVRTAFLGVRAR